MIKSPCKDCPKQGGNKEKCIKSCDKLKKVQAMAASIEDEIATYREIDDEHVPGINTDEVCVGEEVNGNDHANPYKTLFAGEDGY